MKTNATVEIEDITPKQAEKLLEKLYHNQRHLREGWINRLMGEIKAGAFKLSCDAIVVVDGTLLNGQHRLQAVARSGIACPFLVMRSEDPNIYKIIDSGVKRSISDVITGENKNTIAAAAVWIMQYDQKTLTPQSRKGGTGWQREIIRSKVIAFIDKHREALQACVNACAVQKDRKLITPTVGAAIMFLGDREGGGASGHNFMTDMYEGEKAGIISLARKTITANALSRKKWAPVYTFGLLIKAFKHWEAGTRPEELRLKLGETFPSFNK